MTASAITQLIYMSKKTIFAATTALLAASGIIALASCSSDDEIVHSNYPADNIVRIDAGVNNMTTRASVETGTLAGPISVSIHNANSNHGELYCYNNISVSKSGNTWTPASQMLWQNATQPVTVIAYAPIKDLATTDSIYKKTDFPVDVAVEQGSTTYESDFLVYKKEVNPGSDLNSNNALSIAFNHAMSQLNITVKFGTELDATAQGGKLTSNPIEAKSLKVGGTKRAGTCNFTAATPAVKADENAPATDIEPYESAAFVEATGLGAAQETSNATQAYSCILIPQNVAAGSFKVSFTIGGKNYVWTSTQAVNLEGGNSYTLELTVGKDYVVAGNMTATPWTVAGESSIETD